MGSSTQSKVRKIAALAMLGLLGPHNDAISYEKNWERRKITLNNVIFEGHDPKSMEHLAKRLGQFAPPDVLGSIPPVSDFARSPKKIQKNN